MLITTRRRRRRVVENPMRRNVSVLGGGDDVSPHGEAAEYASVWPRRMCIYLSLIHFL